MNFGLKVKVVMASFLLFIIVSPSVVFAKKTIGDAFKQLEPVTERTGIQEAELEPIAGRAIKGGLMAIGVIFFVLMVYAGMTWMTARGDEGSVEKAQKTIVAATIGIVLVVGSYAMTNLVVDRLINKTPGPPVPGAAEGQLVNEGPEGCCVDWVSSDPSNDTPQSACRVTTLRDCKLQGETVNDYDRFACSGPQDGCWAFAEIPAAFRDLPREEKIDRCANACSGGAWGQFFGNLNL